MIRAASTDSYAAPPAERASKPTDPTDKHADAVDKTDAAPADSFRAHMWTQRMWSKPKAIAAATPPALQLPPIQQPLPELDAAASALATTIASAIAALAEPATGTPPASAPVSAPVAKPAIQASDDPTATNSPVQAAIDQSPSPQAAAPALTPLEQAVHDLISQLPRHDDPEEPIAQTATAPLHTAAPPLVATPQAPQPLLAPMRNAPVLAPTAIAEPRPLPEMAAPSHLHLVLGDDSDRVVMTIAVRGADVNVTLRASDDQTAASLARNAASLDHALRARGLNLTELAAEHDHQDRRDSSDRPAPERDPRDDAQPFVLEEAS